LFDEVVVVVFDGMVGLIEGQDARSELLGRFQSSQHGVEQLIVERLSDIEFYDMGSLFFVPDQLEMLELSVVLYVLLFLLNGSVFLPYKGHEVTIG
jgi:hypothetical protein